MPNFAKVLDTTRAALRRSRAAVRPGRAMEADDYPEFPTLEQLALDALRDAILSSHFAPPSLASLHDTAAASIYADLENR